VQSENHEYLSKHLDEFIIFIRELKERLVHQMNHPCNIMTGELKNIAQFL